jgi:hypothetical protein
MCPPLLLVRHCVTGFSRYVVTPLITMARENSSSNFCALMVADPIVVLLAIVYSAPLGTCAAIIIQDTKVHVIDAVRE